MAVLELHSHGWRKTTAHIDLQSMRTVKMVMNEDVDLQALELHATHKLLVLTAVTDDGAGANGWRTL